ncbi:MAG TPA: MFS transporter [Burkholderiales bacterium]|nr:MFS transporter [Burkholderiales bacterium]
MNEVPVTPPQTAQHRPLRILAQVLAAPERYTRPWYFAYLLLGIVTAGMVPVLLPLMMMGVSHELSSVAYVMGVYDLGLLTSPLWGVLAERRKLYRSLFMIAFVFSIVAIAAFPFMHSLTGWMLAALVLGAGSSGAATVASLLIVDFEPSKEWEPRIGLLQSFNGGGQVVGLLLAGAFSHGAFSAGLWLAAILLLPALVFARMGLPPASRAHQVRSAETHPHRLLDMRALAAFPHINLPAGIEFHFHALNMSGLRRLPAAAGGPFGRFLLSWFMLALGVAGFFTYFPLMLAHSYGLNSHFSSVIYAGVAAVGIGLFVLASRWSARLGSGRVYQFGLWLRLVGFALLMLPLVVPLGHRFAFAAVGFGVIVFAWPILSVSGTDLAARLAPFSEGAAMGLFNAALALATMIGAFVSGSLMASFGYRSIAVMGLLGIGLAIVLGWRLMPHTDAPQDETKAPSGAGQS